MASKRIHWGHVLTVGGAGILVGTEVIALTWAAGWALGGLLELPRLFATALELIGLSIGLAASYYFVRAALRVEPILAHADAGRQDCSVEKSMAISSEGEVRK